MAQMEPNAYAVSPNKKKLSWSWKAAIFIGFYHMRQSERADKIFALEATFPDYAAEIVDLLHCMFLAGCFIGFISECFPYNESFSWRAAMFAVLLYGRHFGGAADAEDIINQCFAQKGDGRICRVHMVNTAAALLSICFAGYFFEFIVTVFARGQRMKLSYWTITMGRLCYFLYSGLSGDVIGIIFSYFSKEEPEWHVVETVSGLLLTYFAGLIVGDLPRILSIVSRSLSAIASILEALEASLCNGLA